MACYIGVARIAWANNNCSSSLLRGGVSSSPLLTLFSSYSRTQIHRHKKCHLRLPLAIRYKSTAATAETAAAEVAAVEAADRGKLYTLMTKPCWFGSLSVISGHASSLCTVLAYCNGDMITLRSLAISSGVLSITFQYFRPQPLWIPIGWSAILLCINGYMVTQLLIERHKANHLSPQLQKIYDEGGFDERGFSKIQFMKFFEQSRRVVFTNNEMISQEGREMNKL